jgi:hypothetical protein
LVYGWLRGLGKCDDHQFNGMRESVFWGFQRLIMIDRFIIGTCTRNFWPPLQHCLLRARATTFVSAAVNQAAGQPSKWTNVACSGCSIDPLAPPQFGPHQAFKTNSNSHLITNNIGRDRKSFTHGELFFSRSIRSVTVWFAPRVATRVPSHFPTRTGSHGAGTSSQIQAFVVHWQAALKRSCNHHS